MKRVADVADAVFRIPGVEYGGVYQCEQLNSVGFAPISGTAGARRERITRDTAFRVFLRHGGKFADVEKSRLREALGEVFASVGIDLAGKLAELAEKQATHRARKASLLNLPDKERPAAEKKWSRVNADFEQTASMLTALQQWVAAPPADGSAPPAATLAASA